MCDRCPEAFDTDGKGFPHPAVRKGRKALRVCKSCQQAVPVERWSIGDFFHCKTCAKAEADGLKVKVLRAKQSPVNARQWLCEMECGHEVWRSANKKPTAFACSHCAYARLQEGERSLFKPRGGGKP